MGFPKRLLGADEDLVLELRRHIKVLAGPAFLLIVLAVVTGVLLGLVPDGAAHGWLQLAIGVLALGVFLRWVLWPFLVWWNTIYAVTTRRLALRSGVLNRSGQDMPLSRLNNIAFERNLIQRMLGCGTLVVESAGEDGRLVLDDVPKVERVQRTLYELSDDARAAGGRAAHPASDVDPVLRGDIDGSRGPGGR